MRFLRENKRLIFAAMSLPLFFFYLDETVVSFLKNYVIKKSFVYDVFDYADPFIIVISHGTTLVAVAIVLFLFGKFYSRKCRNAGKALLLGFMSTGIVVQVLKHLVGRIRPRLTDALVFVGPTLNKGYDSFPSGHTMTAFCFAYILSSFFPRYKIFFYIWAVFIGVARVEGIAHFPSDVVAGAVLGIAIAKLLLVKVFSPEMTVRHGQSSESRRELAPEERS